MTYKPKFSDFVVLEINTRQGRIDKIFKLHLLVFAQNFLQLQILLSVVFFDLLLGLVAVRPALVWVEALVLLGRSGAQ